MAEKESEKFHFIYKIFPGYDKCTDTKSDDEIAFKSLIHTKDKRIDQKDITYLFLYNFILPNITGIFFSAVGYFTIKTLQNLYQNLDQGAQNQNKPMNISAPSPSKMQRKNLRNLDYLQDLQNLSQKSTLTQQKVSTSFGYKLFKKFGSQLPIYGAILFFCCGVFNGYANYQINYQRISKFYTDKIKKESSTQK